MIMSNDGKVEQWIIRFDLMYIQDLAHSLISSSGLLRPLYGYIVESPARPVEVCKRANTVSHNMTNSSQ